jgi:3',5'-cyclic AMP phosphodiesterase CpdA
MRIVHISDLHCTQVTWNPLRLLSKRFLGSLNWFFLRNSEFSQELLEPLPELFSNLQVDLVLFGGDFTTTSLRKEYQLAQEFVSKLSEKWLAVPGNHDHYTYWSYKKKRFYNYFTNPSSPFPFTLKEHGVEAHQIEPNWWTIALDTTRATGLYSSRGLFSQKTETHMKELLKLIPENAKIIVLNHYPFFQNDAHRRNLERGEALQSLLEKDLRIHLYLHGHTHRQIIANLKQNNLPITLDSGSCTKNERASWHLIDLKTDGCEVSVYTWNEKWNKTKMENFSWMNIQ